MSAAGTPIPTNYQEWLDCFRILRSGAADRAYVDSLKRGSLRADGKTLEQFQLRLVDAINAMLNQTVSRFWRRFLQSEELTDFDSAALLYRRLLDDYQRCLFFEALEFLPAAFRDELSASVRQQMRAFTELLLRALGKGDEVLSPDAEDAIFAIEKLWSTKGEKHGWETTVPSKRN